MKENMIIFESFRGDYYSDSPKYLYEYLYNNYKDNFRFIWVINDKNKRFQVLPNWLKDFRFPIIII